jgi:hypothetical protein
MGGDEERFEGGDTGVEGEGGDKSRAAGVGRSLEAAFAARKGGDPAAESLFSPPTTAERGGVLARRSCFRRARRRGWRLVPEKGGAPRLLRPGRGEQQRCLPSRGRGGRAPPGWGC